MVLDKGFLLIGVWEGILLQEEGRFRAESSRRGEAAVRLMTMTEHLIARGKTVISAKDRRAHCGPPMLLILAEEEDAFLPSNKGVLLLGVE